MLKIVDEFKGYLFSKFGDNSFTALDGTPIKIVLKDGKKLVYLQKETGDVLAPANFWETKEGQILEVAEDGELLSVGDVVPEDKSVEQAEVKEDEPVDVPEEPKMEDEPKIEEPVNDLENKINELSKKLEELINKMDSEFSKKEDVEKIKNEFNEKTLEFSDKLTRVNVVDPIKQTEKPETVIINPYYKAFEEREKRLNKI